MTRELKIDLQSFGTIPEKPIQRGGVENVWQGLARTSHRLLES